MMTLLGGNGTLLGPLVGRDAGAGCWQDRARLQHVGERRRHGAVFA